MMLAVGGGLSMRETAFRAMWGVTIAVAVSLVANDARAQTVSLPPLGQAYPPSTRGTQVDVVGGVRVPDPYRWLENVESSDVRAWVSAQAALAETYLGRLPRRSEMGDLVARMEDHPRVGLPITGGDRVFFSENRGLANQPTWYVQDRADAPSRVLIDPSSLSRDGLIGIVGRSASPDGRYLAYAVSTKGSTWLTVRVRDVRSNQDLGESLVGIRRSPLAWTFDERGFFYVRSDLGRPVGGQSWNPLAPEGRQQLFYHRVGHAQSDDQLIFEAADHPDWRLTATVSPDGEYLVIAARPTTEPRNRLYMVDLDNAKRPNLRAPLVRLFDLGDAEYEFVSNVGPLFFVRTNKGAPRWRVVAFDINSPDETRWTTVVQQTYDPLIDARRVGNRLIVHRIQDAHSLLEVYALDGGPRGTIPLPGIGSVTALETRGNDRFAYFTFTSFLQAPTAIRFDFDDRASTTFRNVPGDSSLAGFETTQLFFAGKDGTRVPMFITARRGMKLDGTHATLLTTAQGGAFGVSATPASSAFVRAWLASGGVYAVANVRGGGEYGPLWHEAAIGIKKQTSIDDLIAAAEFLVDQHYSQPPSLGLAGRGHGALIAAAALLQRPQLFGAAALDDGLYDMTRFDRFGMGSVWTTEYGSPSEPAVLKAMLSYSPLQIARQDVNLPPVLLTVAEHDDAVSPANSYKLAAALQASAPGKQPVLLRVLRDMGRGPGAPLSTLMAADSDRLSFLVNALHAMP
jgi:prolyl oligopeptidase